MGFDRTFKMSLLPFNLESVFESRREIWTRRLELSIGNSPLVAVGLLFGGVAALVCRLRPASSENRTEPSSHLRARAPRAPQPLSDFHRETHGCIFHFNGARENRAELEVRSTSHLQ